MVLEEAQEEVSIHAPAWGATGLDLPLCGTLSSFNPRARVGRDVRLLRVMAESLSFNPRARVGRDTLYPAGDELLCGFQSTRPRGARPRICSIPTIGVSFNPRARVGRDSFT